MPVVISCSHCRKPVGVPDHALGKRVRCPFCGEEFVASAPPAATPETASAVAARPPARAAAPSPFPAAPARAEPAGLAPEAGPAAASAAPLPGLRARRAARSGGRKPFPWLIASSVGFGLAAVVGVVLVLVLMRADKAEERLPDNLWREVKNEQGLFRVLMPGTPQLMQNAPGFAMTGVEMDNHRHGFFVGFGDVNEAEMLRVPLEQRFDSAREALVQAQKGGRLLSEKKITVDGHPGRELEWEMPENLPNEPPQMMNHVARLCGAPMRGKLRFYLVLASGAGYRADVPDIRKFLDSFHPLPEPAAPPGGPADKGPPQEKKGPPQEKKGPLEAGPKDVPPPAEKAPAADPNRPAYRHRNEVVGLTFREQGKWLFTATEGREILCWDTAAGRLQRTFAVAENGPMGAFAVSPDGRRVALTLHGGLLRLTDVETGAAATLSPQGGGGVTQFCVGFSPDGKLLATGHGDRVVKIWDVGERRLRHTLTDHTNQVLSLAFSPDGRTLATADADRLIRLWDPATGQRQGALGGHKPARVPWDGFRQWRWNIPALAFSPDGKLLASASNDQSVILWDMAQRGQWKVLPHRECVLAVAFSADGKRLATGTAGGEVTLWGADGWQERGRVRTAKAPVRALAFTPDGARLAIAAGGEVELTALDRP
jgi:hypothetical protein